MNILYTNFHKSENINGHSIYIKTLLEEFVKRHNVHVATPGGSALSEIARKIKGVKVVDVEYSSRVYKIKEAVIGLREIIIKKNIDLVHVNGSADHRAAMLAVRGLRRKPKILFTKHNSMEIGWWGGLIKSILGTDGIIAVSASAEKIVRNSAYSKKPIFKIENGVDGNIFRPASEEDKRLKRIMVFGSEMSEKIVIGSNAGTGEYKGWMSMVRAVAMLEKEVRRRFHIAIAGGELRKEDVEEISGLNLEGGFSYLGMLEDVTDFVSSMDIGFVLSNRVETISFACREMMMGGNPVIVTDYSSLPDNVVDKVDGWIVPVNGVNEIKDVLNEINNDFSGLKRMGLAAREKALEKFGVSDFLVQTENAYFELVR